MKSKLTTSAAMVLCSLLTLSHSALADTKGDMRTRLKTDLVTQADGKFILERFRLCQVLRPEELGGGATKPFQVKAHVEAPADGVISRDNFVALFTELALSLRIGFAEDLIKGLTPVQALAALQCKPIDAPIGTADLEVNVSMTGDGVQLEVLETASGQKDRQTTTWAQVFGQ